MTGPAAPAACSGVAFPLTVRLAATALVAGMLWRGARALPRMSDADWSTSAAVLLAGALVIVGWCLAWIWRSRTEVDAEGIRQSWMWSRSCRWDEVVQARLLAVPGFEWLIAPRLVARLRGGRVATFHCADRQLLMVVVAFVATGRRPFAGPADAQPA